MCTVVYAPLVFACGCIHYYIVHKLRCSEMSQQGRDFCKEEESVIEDWYPMNSHRKCNVC